MVKLVLILLILCIAAILLFASAMAAAPDGQVASATPTAFLTQDNRTADIKKEQLNGGRPTIRVSPHQTRRSQQLALP